MTVRFQFSLVLILVIVSETLSIHGNGLYDPKEEICCESEIQPRLYGNATRCCKNRIYNGLKEMCCSNDATGPPMLNDHIRIMPLLISPKSKARTLNERAMSKVNFLCCGNQSLDSEVQVCCDGKPMDKLFRNTGCCGSKIYDEDRFECCSGGEPSTVLARRLKGKGTSCCGSQGYNPRRQICCEGKLHRNWGSVMSCCGSESFVLGQEVCCGRTITNDPFGLLGCCGNGTYEIYNEICCNGVVSEDTFHKKACCGSVAYVTKKEMCCEGRVVNLRGERNVTMSCCGSSSYDPYKDICCGGLVVRLPPANRTDGFFSCCGQKVFDEKDELCCAADSIRDRQSLQSRCCGTGTYEKDKEICCGSVVLRKDTHEDATLVELGLQTNGTIKCCRNQIVEVPQGYELCC